MQQFKEQYIKQKSFKKEILQNPFGGWQNSSKIAMRAHQKINLKGDQDLSESRYV